MSGARGLRQIADELYSTYIELADTLGAEIEEHRRALAEKEAALVQAVEHAAAYEISSGIRRRKIRTDLDPLAQLKLLRKKE